MTTQHEREDCDNMERYSIEDFVYWLRKYNDIDSKEWTKAEIASIVAKALINFLPETDTSY